MQRKTLVLAVTSACTAAGLVTWWWLDGPSGIQYRTATVDHGDINVTISATGNPNAVVTVQVGSQVSGNILALFADFNTKVTKGELIARIDPAPFQTKVNQAQANLDAARAAVANSQAVVQQALAGIQAAQSGLAAARANGRAIEAAQQSLEISTVQYRGGLTNYLQVITAQTSLLQNQRAAVDILTRRLAASVSLIQALGGGWDASQLPSLGSRP